MTQISDADHAAIQKVTDEFAEGFRTGNLAAVAALYTADAVLMPPNVPTASGRSEIQAFLETFPPVSQFELQQITVDGSEDLAFVHGTYTMTLVMPDGTAVPDTGKYLEIRRRQSDGRWLLTHDMFSSDSPEPEM